MKKVLSVVFAAALLAGCSGSSAPAQSSAKEETPAASEAAAEETKEVQTVGEYTIYNATGETVSELYLYPVGSADKGENLAGDHGLYDAHAAFITYDAGEDAEKTTLVLEFTTGSGYNAKFETLHIETAPITLIPAADVETGATPLTFSATTAAYTIYNQTGEEVTELYLYPTGSADKGENLVAGAADVNGSQEITFDKVPENLITADGVGSFTLEFTTASGYNAKFETLSYEVAPICLIAADAMTGATAIKFGAPQN